MGLSTLSESPRQARAWPCDCGRNRRRALACWPDL